jgi:copper(I)-binding protein
MGLHAPLEYGQAVNLTLEFEKSGQIVVASEVRRE